MIRNLKNDKRGAASAEYALLLGLVAIAAVGGMSYIGNQIELKMSQVGACIANPTANGCG